jgi:hypothetical protein
MIYTHSLLKDWLVPQRTWRVALAGYTAVQSAWFIHGYTKDIVFEWEQCNDTPKFVGYQLLSFIDWNMFGSAWLASNLMMTWRTVDKCYHVKANRIGRQSPCFGDMNCFAVLHRML